MEPTTITITTSVMLILISLHCFFIQKEKKEDKGTSIIMLVISAISTTGVFSNHGASILVMIFSGAYLVMGFKHGKPIIFGLSVVAFSIGAVTLLNSYGLVLN